MIPRAVIDEVIRRTDLQQLIRSYVQLRRSGSNYLGLCPFHSEKTASFTVFTGEHEGFYCFGCGAGGDAITFVKKMENLEYPEAVAFLAARVGINVEDTASGAEHGPSRERIRALNLSAARFFHSCLLDESAGKKGMEYLRARKISLSTIKHFYLGYAPESFTAVGNALRAQGFTDEELVAGFICGRGSKGPFDYFRGRVIFPIVDTSRNIVGFGGRVLDDSQPKYLNTSDTPAFRKRSTLFAMNYAKDSCADGLILCEGYMDVISLHQAGFTNAVATLGTSITDDHARIISRYAKKVFLSYDSDSAGQNATSKASAALEKVGVEVRIIRMTGAKDPDEFIKKYGKDAFSSLLEGSVGEFDFRLDRILASHPTEVPSELLKASDEISSLIAGYPSSVERDLYIAKACEKTGVRQAALSEDVARKIKKRRYDSDRRDSAGAVSIARFLGDRVNPDAAGNVRAANAEDTVLALLMMYDEYRSEVAAGTVALGSDDFFTSFGKKAFSGIMRLHSSEGGFDFSLLGEEFDVGEMSRLEGLRVRRLDMFNGREVLISSIGVLKEERSKEAAKKGSAGQGQEGSGSGESLMALLEARKRALEKEKKG